MAATSMESSSVTVGTLKSNPSMFFDQMDSMKDQQIHQHTASMLSMPSNFVNGRLDDLVRERDEEDGKLRHLSLPEEREDDDFETDDDFTIDDEDDTDHRIINGAKRLDDGATSADDDVDPFSESTTMQQTSSNASNPRKVGDAKAMEEDDDEDGSPSFLQSMDTENFDDIHVRNRSGGLSDDAVTATVYRSYHRPSERKSRLGSTLRVSADVDHSEDDNHGHGYGYGYGHGHGHSHSDHDHSHSDWSHEDHKEESDSAPSHTTMSIEEDMWNGDGGDALPFPECNIRFEEDDWCDGKKPPAEEFVSLRFFFQFVYDQIHCYTQFLLDTSLPMYAEWKKMRKVTIRPNSLKTVDYALKDCLKCSQSIKALVKSTIILCLDDSQPAEEQVFSECEDLAIRGTAFNVGLHSIMPAWDLFDGLGSTPSANDWVMALSLDEGVAQKLSSRLPDLSHLNDQGRRNQLAYHRGHQYKYLMISEFLNENGHFLQFGAGPIQWKKIKKRFLEKHGDEYGNDILNAFDKLSYFINPRLSKLNALLNDVDTKKHSSRRIVAEPIMWLYYMVSFLIQRQEKLTQLYVAAMKYSNDNSSNQRVHKCVSELAKQAKDESERLRAVMTRLPGTEDLKQTLIGLVKRRDPEGKQQYTKSLKQYKF